MLIALVSRRKCSRVAQCIAPQVPIRDIRILAERKRPPTAVALLYSAGLCRLVVVSKSFMSAATRNCPAFFIASIRFDPGGNFLAFSSASDAGLPVGSIDIAVCVRHIFSLLRRTQLTGKPTAHAGFHRVTCDNHCANVTAFLAFEGSPVEAGWSSLDF
jgi:hypothetical protein